MCFLGLRYNFFMYIVKGWKVLLVSAFYSWGDLIIRRSVSELLLRKDCPRYVGFVVFLIDKSGAMREYVKKEKTQWNKRLFPNNFLRGLSGRLSFGN